MKPNGFPDFDMRNELLGHPRFDRAHRHSHAHGKLVLGQKAIVGLYAVQNACWGLGNIRRHAAKNRKPPQRCADGLRRRGQRAKPSLREKL